MPSQRLSGLYYLSRALQQACWTGGRAPAIMTCIQWKWSVNGQMKNARYKSQSKEPYILFCRGCNAWSGAKFRWLASKLDAFQLSEEIPSLASLQTSQDVNTIDTSGVGVPGQRRGQPSVCRSPPGSSRRLSLWPSTTSWQECYLISMLMCCYGCCYYLLWTSLPERRRLIL